MGMPGGQECFQSLSLWLAAASGPKHAHVMTRLAGTFKRNNRNCNSGTLERLEIPEKLKHFVFDQTPSELSPSE